MPLASIHNGRGFFSDYWLGSLQGSRRGAPGPRLTAAKTRKLLRRLYVLRQRVDRLELLSLTDFRERFARPLMEDIFGYSMLEASQDPRLRGLVQVQEDGKPSDNGLLAIALLEPDPNELDNRASRNKIGRALAESDRPYGFIVTPDCIRLMRRPGEGTRNAFFDFSVASASEADDGDSLAAAYRILSAESLSPDDNGECPIELLERESRKQSARVSEDLKQAVFSSAEMLIRGFLEDVRNRPQVFDPEPSLSDLRDTALLCLYRLLFIFYAESRDERLQYHELYLKGYSLERLIERLLTLRDEDIHGNRYTFWKQLQALFRIYNDGLDVGNIPGLQNIPPRGGRLFSGNTKEGKLIAKSLLPDTIVTKLLLMLAATRPRRGVGRERVSFRELEIQQLGAVYEGLLEYEPRIADETMIEVRVSGKEYVLVPGEVVRLCEQKQLVVKGEYGLVKGTDAAVLHPEHDECDGEDDGADEAEAGSNNGADEGEDKGVKKGATARLVRRLAPGDFYFVPGSARKSSGSYYTREEIVQYLVGNALHDLTEKKSAAEIEGLRVIDPACGSGHFLVGAARYLGKRLYEAYKRELKGEPPRAFYPDRELTAGVREEWQHEGDQWCKRRVVEKCLFGVDLNPTAVQLAQVALWIESLAGDRPLSFFAHHVRPGNSLLGTWVERLHEAPHPDYDPQPGQRGLFEQNIDVAIGQALDERLLIDDELPPEVRPDTPEEYEYKADRLRRAEEMVAHARLLFDLRNAAAFIPAVWADWQAVLLADDLPAYARSRPWHSEFLRVRDEQRFFHWDLEFPEVFRGQKQGFDCVLGNPPWDKVKPDRKEFYGRVDILIRAYIGGELDARIRELHADNPDLEKQFEQYSDTVKTIAACVKKTGEYRFCDWKIDDKSTGGDPDLFKFFTERAHRILRIGGRVGYLVPSAVYNNEGCTGLRHLMLDNSDVVTFYGFENRKKIFNIHSSYKFVCLALEKREATRKIESAEDSEFHATFMRHDVEELEHGPPEGIQVLVRRSELEKLSPGTLAFLEYRSEKDRQIILKMYGLLSGMEPRPLLGDQGAGTWNAKFYREFDMANDRDLWTKPDGKLYTPKKVCGLDYPNDASIPFSEVRTAMTKEGFWPLYEGKHIEQFLVNIKPIERWLDIQKAEKKNGHPPSDDRKLVFRDIASNTNERTCLSAVLPRHSCSGNTLATLTVDEPTGEGACTILNSLCFDFNTRLKTAGTHLNWTYMSRVVVPVLSHTRDLPTVTTVESEHIGGRLAIADHEPAFADLWQANRAVAEAYGLTADDFEHILSTFPVFARKRPEFFAYLQERVKEWKEER